MMSYRMERKRSCGSCLRYCMIVVNIVFALIAAAVIGVFVYFQKTQVDFVSAVLGTDMVIAASGLLIASGCVLLLIAIYGVIIGIMDRLVPFAVYIGFIVTAFFILAAGVICALVFRTWLTEQVRHQMQTTLITFYGVNLEDSWNSKVTTSWDKAQKSWQCCSVDDQSWDIYQQSQWYKEQPGTPGSPTNPKPYVPLSCCVLDSNGEISESNARKCQSTSDGPPARKQGSQYSGSFNSALNYRGCYQAAQDFLINDNVSWFAILVGVGTAIAALMIVGILLSVSVYVTKKRQIKEESFMVEYSNRSASMLY